MNDWVTRLGGIEAAHEGQFSESGAVLLDSHAEQLVVYLFNVTEVEARTTREPSDVSMWVAAELAYART